MRKEILLILPFVVSSCSVSSLNPFKKEELVYTAYTSQEKKLEPKIKLKGVNNVIYYMKREFIPIEGSIVLNSYDGFVIDLGKKNGVSVGDQFISESGAILKVKEVHNDYSIALPTIGNPIVGEKVRKFTFNKVLFLDFTKEKGKKLYATLSKDIKSITLAPYNEGEKFKKLFNLRYPSDFKRKVPAEKLTGYDGYFVVSNKGVEVYDGTKRLLRVFPWDGTPVSSFAINVETAYKVVLDFKTHATSLFTGNIDDTPEDEVVILTDNDIRVYHVKPYGVSKVYKFRNPFPGSYLFHISPIDINKDGKLEFLMDAFYQDTKSVSSALFEIKNGKLSKIASSNLIVSGFDTNGDGVNDTIYGQEVSGETEKLFGKNVYVLKLEGKKLQKLQKVKVPKDFQVTSAQIFVSNGKKYYAYYDLDYFFNVSEKDKIVWRSPIQIGASPNCLYWDVDSYLVSYYITPKPKPIDIDGDGNEEVLFSQNKNEVPHLLRNVYTFDGGRILLLYKDGFSFGWEEASSPNYNMGGIEEFDYLPNQDIFISIFTESSIIKGPKSKLLFLKPKL
ncbi:hypothetical protein Dester_0930 [Desulfurobacterium thermolithotrophum DSM 11699]|uniref:FG-GAP repeat protein n=1 Tax=Desulfurobacterium thermolithotrophum (strain DSM 11699 / BSA) TaxID=868864 RepID=F0S3Z7_DESTD|nr:hypothetical protein [Desulfurobacterium thermolithotrophum]ADY73569.1 hypothetical protein Dester_0930 [Desulfurobacterium thermolithotrophum DSM 11699]